jgi:hypothetical protein
VEAKDEAPGVTFSSPLNASAVNFTINAPTPLVVGANSSSPIRRLTVLIDGKPAHADDRGVVNSAFKVFVGTHHITALATDSSGATSQASVDVTGEPGDLPPTAAITVVPLRNISPTTVLACSVTSHDPDGFILQHRIQFSDGAVFFTPAAVHTLAAPGNFSATPQSDERVHQDAHPQSEPVRRP